MTQIAPRLGGPKTSPDFVIAPLSEIARSRSVMLMELLGELSEGQLAEWYAENACSVCDDLPRPPEEYLDLPLWSGLPAALRRRYARRALEAALGHLDRGGWWGDLPPVARHAIRQISRAFWRDNRSPEQKR